MVPLLLVRHGRAGNRSKWKRDDRLRPLSRRGLRQAKDLGGVDIQACSLSMDLLHLEQADLDPLVDGVEGVTAFHLATGDGQIVFI